MKTFCQEGFERSATYQVLLRDAKKIKSCINKNCKLLEDMNKSGLSSLMAQKFLYDNVAKALGYEYDKRKHMFIPDFFKSVGKEGIIVEVERGRTIENNMDFIDFWKCHTDPDATCLILIVPSHVPRSNNSTRPVFSVVCRRLEPFFLKQNYTNVKALIIISY